MGICEPDGIIVGGARSSTLTLLLEGEEVASGLRETRGVTGVGEACERRTLTTFRPFIGEEILATAASPCSTVEGGEMAPVA